MPEKSGIAIFKLQKNKYRNEIYQIENRYQSQLGGNGVLV